MVSVTAQCHETETAPGVVVFLGSTEQQQFGNRSRDLFHPCNCLSVAFLITIT